MSNKAFIIIQNYSTTYYTTSTFWRILTGNGGKQDIKFMRKKLHYFDTFDISMARHFQYRYARNRNQKV